jgi:hypothetical protein
MNITSGVAACFGGGRRNAEAGIAKRDSRFDA